MTTVRGASSPRTKKTQKAQTLNEENVVQNKKRGFVPAFRFAMSKRSGKDVKPNSSRNGSVVSMSDNRPSSSSNTFVNHNKSQQNKKADGKIGFASRVRSLVTNRSKNTTSTKVLSTKIDSSSELSVTSVPKIVKGFQKNRKKAHESQSFESDGLGISNSDSAKSTSEPALAAQFSASTHKKRGDAFVREASSIASLTSSSANSGGKKIKKDGR